MNEMVALLKRLAIPLLLAGSVTAAARLEMADAVAGSESSTVLVVTMRTEGAPITGLQVDIEYPAQLVSVSALPGTATRAALKLVYQHELAPGRKRILIAGMNATPIADGPVVLLHASAIATVPPGGYPFLLSNVTAVDADGRSIPMETTGAELRIDSGLPNTPLTADGVLNSASMLPGPVAAGELITLLGARLGPTDTAVAFDGVPAPVLFSSIYQLNTLAPSPLAGDQTRIEVLRGSQRLALLTVPVAAAAPGIFTEDASGAGPAVVVLDNGARSSFSNPAVQGSTITIYGTGMDPAMAITATIGTADATVSAVESLGATAPGVTQMRILVPEGISGPALPLLVSAAGISSQAGVTVSIAR